MLTGKLSTTVKLEGEIYRGIGASDYNDLENKPRINGVELVGNKTSESLGIIGVTPFIDTANLIYTQPNVYSGTYTYTATEDCVILATGSRGVSYQIDGVTVFYFDGQYITISIPFYLKKGQTVTLIANRDYNSFSAYKLKG